MTMKTNMAFLTTSRVPRQWAWHYRHLMHLREKLLDEQLPGEIAGATELIEPQRTDMADSATDEFDHDMTRCILSHEQDALHEVDAAIRRIFEGGYGICEESGKPIPAARLRAVPWTRYIREVEERLEQEGLITRTRLGAATSIRRPAPVEPVTVMDDTESETSMTDEEQRHRRQEDLRAIETAADDPD